MEVYSMIERKKYLSITFLLLLIYALTPVLNAESSLLEKKHIYNCGRYKYTLSDDGTCEIVYYWGTEDEIVIPETLDGLTVNAIGDKAFYQHTLFTHVTIPDSVTCIGQSAFEDSDNLISVIIPDSVTSIADMAFKNCDKLPALFIPGSVTHIGKAAFAYCSSLESVVLSNGVTELDDYAFFGCYNLKKISIPDSVTTIGKEVFLYRDCLQCIVTPGSCAESYCRETGLNYVYYFPSEQSDNTGRDSIY